MNWNYPGKYVDISIPKYANKAFKQLQHSTPKLPQYAPYKFIELAYVSKVQYTIKFSTAPKLYKKVINCVKIITGIFFYYERAVNTTIITLLNKIALQQAAPTTDIFKKKPPC